MSTSQERSVNQPAAVYVFCNSVVTYIIFPENLSGLAVGFEFNSTQIDTAEITYAPPLFSISWQ